ncbi:MAG: hypothetical protein ACREA2_19860 [Blastocatellia bacterium]
MAQQDDEQARENKDKSIEPAPTPEIKPEIKADAKTPAASPPSAAQNAAPKEESRKNEPKPPSGATASVTADEIKAKEIYTANQQEFNKTITNIRQIIMRGEAESFQPFSARMAMSISGKRAKEIADSYVCEPQVIEAFLTLLREKGIIVISGEANAGKGTTALYLSHRLRQEEAEPLDDVYLFPTLAPNIKIDLREITANREEFGNRLLFFKDAFARGNHGLREFFIHLDDNVLEALSAQLQQQRTYLIFTADTLTLNSYQAQLAHLRIEAKLPPLSNERLWEGLLKKLAKLPPSISQGRNPTEIENTLAKHKPELLEAARTMPRVVQFIDLYLADLLHDRIDIKEAFRRVDDLTDWFGKYLAEDFPSWCFALTLALTYSSPYFSGISWFEFQSLWERVLICLSDGLRRRGPASDQTPAARPLPNEAPRNEPLSEDFFLQHCHAEIEKDPQTGVDEVRFKNERYAEMLWDVFLNHHRRILVLLLPRLKEMAESGDIRLHANAARIIGRIGEIDPELVVFALLDEWSQSGQPTCQAAVGYLYQGILASRNQRYRELCLEELRELANEEEKAALWTAIAAYKQIGIYDLPLAMYELGNIAERKFTEKFEDTRRLDRIINRIESALENRPTSELETMDLLFFRAVLSEIAHRVFSEEGGLLFVLQYAIVSLCLEVDPLRVFEELQKWTVGRKEALAALIALIFLQENGIAEELEKKSIEIPGAGTAASATTPRCNPIVISIAASDQAVRQMAKFLTTIFQSFYDFYPSRSRNYLQKSFLMHLKSWAQNASSVERFRGVVARLFAELLVSPNQVLGDRIYDLLTKDAEFTDEKLPLFAFAQEAIDHRISARRHRFLTN